MHSPYHPKYVTFKPSTYSALPSKTISKPPLPYSVVTHTKSCTPDQPLQRINPSLIFINSIVNGRRLRAMIDTGATHFLISQRALATLYHAAIPSNHIAQLGDSHTTLKILGEVYLLLQFNQVFTPLNVLVVKTLNTVFILGAD